MGENSEPSVGDTQAMNQIIQKWDAGLLLQQDPVVAGNGLPATAPGAEDKPMIAADPGEKPPATPDPEDKTATETPKIEAKEEVKEDPVAEKVKLRKEFEELARRDRMIRQRQREFKELKKKAEEWEALQKKAKENPEEYLKAGGVDLEYFTQYLLNDKKAPEEKKLELIEREIQTLREREKEREASIERQKYEQVVSGYKDSLNKFIQENDKWELAKRFGAADVVYNTVEEYHRQHQRVLSNEEALEMVEPYLETEAKQIVDKFLETEKIKKYILEKINGSQPVKPPPVEVKAPTGSIGIKSGRSVTLTNHQQAMTVPPGNGKSDDNEDMKRAAALLRFQ